MVQTRSRGFPRSGNRPGLEVARGHTRHEPRAGVVGVETREFLPMLNRPGLFGAALRHRAVGDHPGRAPPPFPPRRRAPTPVPAAAAPGADSAAAASRRRSRSSTGADAGRAPLSSSPVSRNNWKNAFGWDGPPFLV
jgi:hypothetical protein